MRKTIIAGNWKMYTDRHSALELAEKIAREVDAMPPSPNLDVVVCPPFPFLPLVHDMLRNTPVSLGAQTVHHKKEGAYTGEVSAPMLMSVGCKYVIVGHSERRLYQAESDMDVCFQANHAIDSGLTAIICVGETRGEREQGLANDRVAEQIHAAFEGIFVHNVDHVAIAYEPIWAIGTGDHAAADMANEMHRYIRSLLAKRFDDTVASRTPIIYGGSLKPFNAAELFSQPEIDGGLVGGASLEAESFLQIVRAAVPTLNNA